jgi:hypothetical protein
VDHHVASYSRALEFAYTALEEFEANRSLTFTLAYLRARLGAYPLREIKASEKAIFC